jgi:hypothetical protein
MRKNEREKERKTMGEDPVFARLQSSAMVWWCEEEQRAFEASWSAPIPKDMEKLVPAYTRAHALLPSSPSAVFDPGIYRRHERRCIEHLERPEECPTETMLLRAILILGHCGTESAVDALTAFGHSDHALSEIAHLALVECAELWCLELNARQTVRGQCGERGLKTAME